MKAERTPIAEERKPPRHKDTETCLCLCVLVVFSFAAYPPAVNAGDGAGTGSIRGKVEPAGQVASIVAVDRANNKKYAGTVEAGGDGFTIDQLPVNAKYDLVIDYGMGRLEGISLTVPRSDYEEEQPLSDDDVKTIREKVLSMNKFEDQVEILAIEGNVQHAAILLNKLRTKPFVNSQPGEAVWRVELWHFERPEETWVKVQDELFLTLYRERLQKSAYDQKSLTFTPALGGLSPTSESPKIDLNTIMLPPAAPGVRWQTRREENDQ